MLRHVFAASAALLLGSTLVACDDSVTTAVSTPTPETRTIAQLASDTPELSILVQALVAADLVDTLQNPSATFTVFAPTNNAFAALPAGTLDFLLQPENVEQLRSVLLFHVTNGALTASTLSGFSQVQTLQGTAATIAPFGNTLRINNQANVIAADIEASNGVVHLIDRVLIP